MGVLILYKCNNLNIYNVCFAKWQSGFGKNMQKLNNQKIKAIIAYDGTDFFGWQKQPEAVSISSTLEQTFSKVFGYQINLIGASRTDTGVHALEQVAMFKTELCDLDLNIIKSAWNNMLPKSILIRDLQVVPDEFHACFNVAQKTYYYHLFFKRPLPFLARYAWLYKFIDQVDLGKFENALNLYVGQHDFGSFCKVDAEDRDPSIQFATQITQDERGEEPARGAVPGVATKGEAWELVEPFQRVLKFGKKSTIRTIDSVKLERLDRLGMLRVTVKGPGFLRFQIRRMIGYALDVARRKNLSVNYIKTLLENPDPRQTLLKAEACGLCLRKVVYKK